MITGLNKDTLIIATILAVAAACAFLYKENMKAKEELASVKSFSINLANRIPPKLAPVPVTENPAKPVEEDLEEE